MQRLLPVVFFNSNMMDIDDFFNTKEEIQEPINMAKDEFVAKTKKLLAYIESSYGKGWKDRSLKEEEFPKESICDKCTGCGTFKLDGEDAECTRDFEEGECYESFSSE